MSFGRTRSLNRADFWQGLVFFYNRFLRGRCKNVDGSCPFSHKIDRDKVSFKLFIRVFLFPWLLEISYPIPKLTFCNISVFFHHFRCQFVSFFFVVNVPTTTVLILTSTLARRRKCARIFSKGSVHEDNKCVYSHCWLFSCSLLSFVLPCNATLMWGGVLRENLIQTLLRRLLKLKGRALSGLSSTWNTYMCMYAVINRQYKGCVHSAKD